MFKEFNVKENLPTVEEAIGLIQIEIECCKKEGIKVLKVVHGYGSSGVGGNIFLSLKKHLVIWKKSGYILDYLFGDQWNSYNKKAMDIKYKFPSLPLDKDFNHSNMGMTIILL